MLGHLFSGNHTCPTDQQQLDADQSDFWNPLNENWDAHKVGWIVCGVCGIITVLFTLFSVISHAHNYRVPGQQRQILRILYLPMIYGILFFLSYRFFSAYTYFSLGAAVYEAFALGAFLLLLVNYVAATGANIQADVLYRTKCAVLQYAIVKPLIAIVTVITQEAGVLCQGTWDFHFASPYLRIIDLLSMGYALYGLIKFYKLTKDLLAGRRALAKFIAVKIVIFLSVVQNFLLTILDKHNVIHGTKLWTESNVVNGINAICICVEMVLVSALMLWAYSPSEYKMPSAGEKRSVWRAYWDAINISDVIRELVASLQYVLSGSSGQPAWTQADAEANRSYDRTPYSAKESGEPLATAPYSYEGKYGSQEYQPPAYPPQREGHHHHHHQGQ
ncbi:hypothetical protein FRC04_011848 [Tulasnella sp. 424]|nr:hypothetical protein FRC04_011848 [Tulasnella sp. 424]KAG8971401.1 hypothetical protein FRC05_011080 [Tulasnella sp. 425]